MRSRIKPKIYITLTTFVYTLTKITFISPKTFLMAESECLKCESLLMFILSISYAIILSYKQPLLHRIQMSEYCKFGEFNISYLIEYLNIWMKFHANILQIYANTCICEFMWILKFAISSNMYLHLWMQLIKCTHSCRCLNL